MLERMWRKRSSIDTMEIRMEIPQKAKTSQKLVAHTYNPPQRSGGSQLEASLDI
jgi:hypothetical protein